MTITGDITTFATPGTRVGHLVTGPDGAVWFTGASKIGRVAMGDPTITVTNVWNAKDNRRLLQMAAHYHVTAVQLEKLAVNATAYVLTLLPSAPSPVTLPATPRRVAATYVTEWDLSELPALAAVTQHCRLNDSDAVRFAVYILSYLLHFQGI